ncbi:aldehyde dehydrogenase [Microbacterium sp. CH12i]|uniref:aldehyde dehydrogenase n=1 Tax=Microbacterium sp. CH12i TaxID=1479651 RepID=UPI000461C98C|nr:aldehyde dehydrogenase [Microbacterium sp. CH12i]KDA05322.1 aldehyde dehydrogenase [Microbacterium sp. CH12i]
MAASITVINPADLSVVGTAPDGGAADVDSAVRAARLAFDEGPWPRMSGAERADWMERLADELERRGSEFAALVTDEIGQPVGLSSVMNGIVPGSHLRYYADQARQWQQEELRPNVTFPGESLIRREPIGVAGLITPWNYPLSLLTSKLAPALAVGCTVVAKPAAETPLDALLLAEAVTAIGFPSGVINVVTGGRETGAVLVSHPGIDKIAFTGSTAAGQEIAAQCGRRLIPVTLELGGKSAAVVLDDADLEQTLDALRGGSFMNSGQTCFLLSRVIVPERRAAEFTEGLVEVARGLTLGDPKDPSTDQGPLVSERIRTRVRTMVDEARASGARVLVGGADAAHLPGFYYEPTVVTDVQPQSALAREEIFGPVVTVFTAASDDEAVRLANDSRYGLGGAVFSSDRDRAVRTARRVQSGTLGVNGYNPDLAAPFGGYKDSGLGRENGPEAMQNYVTIKAIYT